LIRRFTLTFEIADYDKLIDEGGNSGMRKTRPATDELSSLTSSPARHSALPSATISLTTPRSCAVHALSGCGLSRKASATFAVNASFDGRREYRIDKCSHSRQVLASGFWRVPKSTAQKQKKRRVRVIVIMKVPPLLANGDYGTLEHPRLVVGALSVRNHRDLPAALERTINADLRHRSKSFRLSFS
jgi:hypothetical protein